MGCDRPKRRGIRTSPGQRCLPAGDQELQALRARLDEALAAKAALEKDREAVKEQVASILRALEALG